MGGQACILYGAAEFSRDVDMAVLASHSNLARRREALSDLRAGGASPGAIGAASPTAAGPPCSTITVGPEIP
jgi:hypothetical protein